MSHDIIQANYDVLESVAQQFAAASQGIEEMLQEVRGGRQNLEGEWVGLGSEAFFSNMDDDVLPITERLRDALAEASVVTRIISLTIRTAEEEAAALLTGQAEPPPTDSGQGAAPPSWWDQWGEWVHGGLDVAGFVPIIGEAADGLNALIYLGEGRHVEAGISIAAMVPLVGDAGKVGKWGVKGARRVAGEAGQRSAQLLLRRYATRPFLDNPQLNRNVIEHMYRGRWVDGQWVSADKYPGGLAGAVRRELATGELVGGRDHLRKANERLSNLKDILRRGSYEGTPLSPRDRRILQDLHDDLLNALQGK